MTAAQDIARRTLLKLLSRMRRERIEIVEGDRVYGLGPADAPLRARVQVHDPRAYTWTARGSTGLCESYVEGFWTSDDLVELSRIACRNLGPFDRLRQAVHPLIGPAQRALTLVPRNTRAGARRNISAHYDLGNELFEAFLDREVMMYSAAAYPSEDATLEQAQRNKVERICAALALGPDDHLLEIGTGWGGLAVHAAVTRGCRVTTTTISREQHAYAAERVRAAGVQDRVELLLTDYRDLTGSYDKLVSIEMIEAVGWQYFPTFFAKCAELTSPGGAMLIQAIVIEDELYEGEKASRSFSNKHIFPGGCLPSVALISQLGAENGMPVAEADEITSSYACTLETWRERFNDAWPTLKPYGYDERFRRLWNFYLAFSEGGFRERRIRDFQLLMAKQGWPGGEDGWRSPTPRPEEASLSS